MAYGFLNIFKIPELKKRILFTIILLGIYRVGIFIPVPGIDRSALSEFLKTAGKGTLFGLYDLFAGGALEQFSIFTLGIMPYISASIIFQLLTVVVPYLDRLSKEGEVGRRKITQYTRYSTVLLAAIQGFAIGIGLEGMKTGTSEVVLSPGWGFRIMTVLTLASGTAFIMWLGEQITEKGIGNGISLIIFAGIVARIPRGFFNTITLATTSPEQINLFKLFLLVVFMIAVVGFIVICERGQRRIPVQYAKKVIGRKVYGGQSTHLPLKINTSGVIPPIFASSIIMFPATISSFVNIPFLKSISQLFTRGTYLYNFLYVVFIVFFCFFYTAVIFNPVDVSDNMKKYGGFIPGIRPGKRTAEYIDWVLTRLTSAGAIYVSFVCIIPSILIYQFNIPFYYGGTSLLIVVGVALDTVAQIESHLLTRHYEGILGAGGRIRGRRR